MKYQYLAYTSPATQMLSAEVHMLSPGPNQGLGSMCITTAPAWQPVEDFAHDLVKVLASAHVNESAHVPCSVDTS